MNRAIDLRTLSLVQLAELVRADVSTMEAVREEVAARGVDVDRPRVTTTTTGKATP